MNSNVGENQRPIEAAPTPSNGEQAASQSVEKSLVSTPENRPQSQSVAVSSQAASDMALPSQAVASGLTDDNAPALPSSTLPADDTDRIEKEWVDKAKTVVARTKDDPYEQKNAMSQVKAEYIHKRFNKTIKADDAVAK